METKPRILYLKKILEEQTDEEHPLSTTQLINILVDEYGISAHRTTVTKDIAALTGHDAAIKETTRLTDERLELSDEVIMKLNDQLNMIRDNIGTEQEVSITYFVPDDKKSGGAYLTHSGIVKKIDEFERKLIMQDETVIPIEQISEIQGEIFKGLYE